MYIVSLGCAKNLVDSEVMLALLENDGYIVVEDPADADLLLVNTCGFILPAVEEAVDEILGLIEYRQQSSDKRLVVTGCFVQRYGDKLVKELAEVDLFVGINGVGEIDTLIKGLLNGGQSSVYLQEPTFLMSSETPRRLSGNFFQAFLKVTEGCDNRCSYCMIPFIRGKLRSRPVDDLVLEAGRLAGQGVQELSLIAQDLTAYGNDLGSNGDNLVFLLKQLLVNTDVPWIRLLYLYPTTVSEPLLELMAANPRIVPYLDIPFQHASDRVLRNMNRHYGFKCLDNLISMIRSYLPNCGLRTTFLVGFPGETDKDIDLLVECLERWQLDHVGVFQYEDEEECAAHGLPDKIDNDEKELRYKRVMNIQSGISARKIKKFIGRVEPVLIEGLSSETDLLLEGRTRYQAPGVDGCVYINDGRANPGDIVPVRISETHIYDLVGSIVENNDILNKMDS